MYMCVCGAWGGGGEFVCMTYTETSSLSPTRTNQLLKQQPQVETSENAWVVLVSFLCMLIYVSVALGRCPDMVRSDSTVTREGTRRQQETTQHNHTSHHYTHCDKTTE